MRLLGAVCVFGMAIVEGQSWTQLKTDEKIRSFAELPAGWHYGDGGPAANETIHIARTYLWHLTMLGFMETDAFPGAAGEIMVAAYRGRHCVEVTVEIDRSFVVTHQADGEDRFHEPGLSGVQACLALEKIAENIAQEECDTFTWFTSDTTTAAPAGSKTLPLRGQAMGPALLSFWKSADRIAAGQSALISTDFTGAWGANQPCFGRLTTQNFLSHA